MTGIGWNIPYATAIDHLEECLSSGELETPFARQKILMTLKIVMKAYELGPELSYYPELAK